MSKPSAFPSLVTCLFGLSDGSSRKIVQTLGLQPPLRVVFRVTGSRLCQAAHNGKRPVA
jgi:hypothetical protein